MSAQSVTLAGRRAAESLMLDAGKALRSTGATVYDPAEDSGRGADVPAYDELFASRCKINTRNLVARANEVGDRTSVTVRTELHLPTSTAPLSVGDVWEMTSVDPLSLAVVGQRLRVVAPVSGSMKTARRYEVEQVVS